VNPADGDDEPLPAGDVITATFDDLRAITAALEHGRGHPGVHVRREVSDDVSAPSMNPDGLGIGSGRIGNQYEGITGAQPMHNFQTTAEDRSVYRSAELLCVREDGRHDLMVKRRPALGYGFLASRGPEAAVK
jgi:hypothetical protein